MRMALIVGMAGLLSTPAIALQSGEAAAPTAPTAPPDRVTLPVLDGAEPAPDCGGLYNLAGRAQCMTAPLDQLGAMGEVYAAALTQTGWTWMGGGSNQVLFQRPDADAGGCDTLEMISFYDISLPEEALAEAPGYLGFAMRTGDRCRTPPPAEEAPAPQGETPQ